jgi:hypothetical protein
MKTLAVVFAVLAFAACGPGMRDDLGDDQGGGDDDGGGGGGGGGEARQCNQMDIVFVVDDSGSMAEEQSNLATNFPMFATLLSSYRTPDGDPIDFRVAVTTTGKDLSYTINFGPIQTPFNEQGDDGAFRNNCNASSRWLDKTSPDLEQTLACRADVGTGGPSFEMPLLMARWALDKRVGDGTNAGFVRPDALLAIVMLTDEDDTSTSQNNFVLTPTSQPPIDYQPADHVAFLDQLKGHRSRWAAAAIAGDGDCSSAFGDAANAARLKDFVNLANGGGMQQATFSSICDGDLTIGLEKALMLFQAACGGIIL